MSLTNGTTSSLNSPFHVTPLSCFWLWADGLDPDRQNQVAL